MVINSFSDTNCNTFDTRVATFPFMDWRFNEFPNEGAHALYVTCVEIMGLPSTEPAKVILHNSKNVYLEFKILNKLISCN